jgi:hypothetical protein
MYKFKKANDEIRIINWQPLFSNLIDRIPISFIVSISFHIFKSIKVK